MFSTDNLCMSCMKEIGEEKKCPYCGFHIDFVQALPYLPIKTVIANRYLLGKVVEYNDEGATYIGFDLTTKKAVNVREFLPSSIAERTNISLNLQVMLGCEGTFASLRRSFEELWSKLLSLSGLSALINVTDVVEDYGTSFAVYDRVDGISLRDFLLRNKTGYISWEKSRSLLMPILQTIGTLHKSGIVHMGISPQTLIIAGDGKIKITGFSIADSRATGGLLNLQIYDGYAAPEQYEIDGKIGPWTDIYAFAAVLYRSLIGSDPISAKERMTNDRLMVPGKFAEALPAYVINGLINALQITPKDRTRTIEQLRAELSASPAATAQGAEYARRQQQQIRQAANSSVQKSANASSQRGKKKKQASGAKIVVTTALAMILFGFFVFGILAVTVLKDRFNFNTNESVETTVAEQISVPNFVEQSRISVSTNQIFNQNFVLVYEEVFDTETSSGYIIRQSIQEGTMVDKGTQITLYVSKGVETIVLPNVVGVTYEEAELRLTDLGFTVKKVVTNEGYHVDGEILSMAPVAEKSYEIGTEVILKCYEEPDSEEETVEDEEYEEIDSCEEYSDEYYQ